MTLTEYSCAICTSKKYIFNVHQITTSGRRFDIFGEGMNKNTAENAPCKTHEWRVVVHSELYFSFSSEISFFLGKGPYH